MSAPASWPARLSLRLSDGIAIVAVLAAVLRLLAVAGLDSIGSGPGSLGGVPMMVLTVCALAGVALGGTWAIRTRAPGQHWGALLILMGPVLVAAVYPLLAGIPAAALALLLRWGMRTRLP